MRIRYLNVDKICRIELLDCRYIALMASVNVLSASSPLQCGLVGAPIRNESLLFYSLKKSQLCSFFGQPK